VRGVKESVDIDSGLIGSQDARMIDQMNAKLREVYTEPPVLRRKEAAPGFQARANCSRPCSRSAARA
jgi:hypothetical protein